MASSMSTSKKTPEECSQHLTETVQGILKTAEGLKRVFNAIPDQPASIIVQMLIADLTQIEGKIPKTIQPDIYSLIDSPPETTNPPE
jgi:uncharacterized protein Yka (UPF0111/DUF47 family)